MRTAEISVNARGMMAPSEAGTRWRVVATKYPLGVGLLAGFLATHFGTISGYWYHGLGLPVQDFPRINGYLFFRAVYGADPEAIFAVSDVVRFLSGWTFHIFTGVVFAFLFVIAIHPWLPWRDTVLGNLGKALVWGAVLATLSALWLGPALLPEFDLGFFSWNLGWKGVFAIYFWHGVWAVILGLIYNPLPADEYREMAV